MKKVLLAVVAMVLLAACSDDKPSWRRDAMVALNGIESAKNLSRSTGEGYDKLLTAHEIVEKATVIRGQNFVICTPPTYLLEVGFDDSLRDLVNDRLLMPSYLVIDPWTNGTLMGDFLDIVDVTLVEWENWTVPNTDMRKIIIAYIPNAVIQKAAADIRAAYAAENYDEVYRLFNEAYTFIPITHNEWLKLKEQGLN